MNEERIPMWWLIPSDYSWFRFTNGNSFLGYYDGDGIDAGISGKPFNGPHLAEPGVLPYE